MRAVERHRGSGWAVGEVSREWKPGDVAMYDGHIAFVWDDEDFGGDRPTFVYTDTDGDPCSVYAEGTNARPLVVIDPEDREQVERLMPPNWHRTDEALDWFQDHIRSLADPKPPKPDEPKGLGAVVEDADGHHWVRIARGRYGWVPANGMLAICEKANSGHPGTAWDEFAAKTLVREGWSE